MMRRGLSHLVLLAALGCEVATPSTMEPPAGQPQPALAQVSHAAAADNGKAPADTAPAGPPTYDWPSFLGPQGTSVSPEKGILSPWPREGLKLVWYKKIGEGYPAPSISRGKLYHFDRYGDQARLTCCKADSGEEIWRFEYPTKYEDYFGYNGGPRCCPVIDDGRVYIFGVEGMLHCLSAADGKLIWKVDTTREFGVQQNFFGVGSTPVVEGDLLLVQIGGSPADSGDIFSGKVTTNGSALVAFDKKTGQVKYRVGEELASYASPVLTTVDGRRRLLLYARNGLMGIDPVAGKEVFHFPWRARVLESVNASNPVVVGNRVLITECYGPGSACLELKPDGVEVIWDDARKRDADKSLMTHWMTPIHHEGYVYGSSGRHAYNADLRCVELATGKVQWIYPDEAALTRLGGRPLARTSLLMVDGHFICLDERGLVLLLKVNPKKYEEVSRMIVRHPVTGENLLKSPAWAAPVLANGLLYLRGDDHLVCLELIPARR